MKRTPRILIVGAGWRVSALVVPALLALGLARSSFHILRRNKRPLDSTLHDIEAVDWEKLDSDYDLTINCVSQEALTGVESRLTALFPRALHFCDTPIFHRLTDLFEVRRLASRSRLYSLEDWPFMPNLVPMFQLCTRSAATALRFEHIGIDTHFLSAVRTAGLSAGAGETCVVSRRHGALTARRVPGGEFAVLTGAKDFGRSKISAWDGAELIEDFLGLRSAEDGQGIPDSPEVVSRVLDGDILRYQHQGTCFRAVEIPRAISTAILGDGGRKGVHELDKCVALMDVLGSALRASPRAYRYVHSAFDTAAARLVKKVRLAVAL